MVFSQLLETISNPKPVDMIPVQFLEAKQICQVLTYKLLLESSKPSHDTRPETPLATPVSLKR